MRRAVVGLAVAAMATGGAGLLLTREHEPGDLSDVQALARGPTSPGQRPADRLAEAADRLRELGAECRRVTSAAEGCDVFFAGSAWAQTAAFTARACDPAASDRALAGLRTLIAGLDRLGPVPDLAGARILAVNLPTLEPCTSAGSGVRAG